MRRKNWAIFDEAGMAYTGDTSGASTGWSTDAGAACLFSTESRAYLHMDSRKEFDGCSVREV